jgi:hypothetical protein
MDATRNRRHDAILLSTREDSGQIEKLDVRSMPVCMACDVENRCGVGNFEIDDDTEPFRCLEKAVLIVKKCM